jgi:DNA-binding IclR family transcriptional regulator
MAGRDKEVEDVAFLLAFLADPTPVLTAAEISEQVGMTRQGAHARLESLEEKGLVGSAMKASARVWWLTEEGGRKAATDVQPDSDGSTG